MDPLSIIASVAGLVSLCIQVGQTVSTLADGAANADDNLQVFRGEIAALHSVLASINVAFSDPARSRVLEAAEHGTGHVGQYWKGVVASLSHCDATLRKMCGVLNGVETSRRTKLFKTFGKHLKLTSVAGVLTLYRHEVQTHTANLQISLQMISICMSLTADDVNADTAVRLDELSDDVRNIAQLLKRTKSDLPEPPSGDAVTFGILSSSRTVVDELTNCIDAAGKLISDASTLADKQSVRSVHESVGAPSDIFTPTQRQRVQEWIDWPITDIVSESSSSNMTPTSSSFVGASSIPSTHATSPMQDQLPISSMGMMMLPVPAEEVEDALSESSDIDSGFKANLYEAGVQFFDQHEYSEAERFLTKAMQASSTDTAPGDRRMLDIKFHLALTLSRQRRWEDSRALLLALHVLVPTKVPSLKWMEASILHELAIVNLGRGCPAKARMYAESASRSRKKTFGQTDPRFYSSIGLLADICDSQGEPVEAEGYRRFIPPDQSYLYTRIHQRPVGDAIDEKEAVILDEHVETKPNPSVDYHPAASSGPPPAAQIPRSFSMGTGTTASNQLNGIPLTHSSEPSFDPVQPPQRVYSDSYIPPRVDAVELPSWNQHSEPPVTLANKQLEGHSSSSPVLKEFIEAFRLVGQYQILGWKDKAVRTALAYYRGFAEHGLNKIVSRYINDAAWRSLERNIHEGLTSLSSTGHGFAAIHFFALLGIPCIVTLLLDRKADVDAKSTGVFGYTQANGERRRSSKLSSSKLGDLARSLSRTSITSVGGPAAADWTPLHFATAYAGDPDTIEVLVRNGANVEERAGKGWTPLLLATRKAALDMERYLDHSRDFDSVRLLVEEGARVDAVDNDGLGVHAHAHCMKTGELADYLLGLTVT
ncbi:hypothetical protein DRE_01166 [Drechslerella stenobrocha 248]|uniref:Uncharacterized protein n=1 Tax=Drechslerella stenobrocha 248 TaxID=1043628 RepID=W7I6D2_9PEZI|nr:hypothetical protein DRE_01166 [Drechslerella stenobrocha 248]